MPIEIEPDPVIEEYKKHVDRTLLRENLKLSPQQRTQNFLAMARLYEEAQRLRRARKAAERL